MHEQKQAKELIKRDETMTLQEVACDSLVAMCVLLLGSEKFVIP